MRVRQHLKRFSASMDSEIIISTTISTSTSFPEQWYAGRVHDYIDKNIDDLKTEYYSPKRRNLRVGILFYEIKITGVLWMDYCMFFVREGFSYKLCRNLSMELFVKNLHIRIVQIKQSCCWVCCMVLIVERKKQNASPLLMSLVVWTHFCISFKGDGLFACYIFMYTKIYLVLMPRSETDADNPFVFGDEGYDVFA